MQCWELGPFHSNEPRVCNGKQSLSHAQNWRIASLVWTKENVNEK